MTNGGDGNGPNDGAKRTDDGFDARIQRALEDARDKHLAEIRSELLDDLYKHKEELRKSGNTAFQSTLVVVGVLVTLLSIGWITQWLDIEKQQQHVSSLSRHSWEVSLSNLALAQNYELRVVREIMEDTQEVLRRIRLDLDVVETDHWDMVHKNETRLRELLDLSGDYTALERLNREDENQAISRHDKETLTEMSNFFRDYRPILTALLDVQLALRELEPLRAKNGNETYAGRSSERTKLNRAFKAWHEVSVDDVGFTNEVFKGFAKELKAHRLNMLGLIETRRFDVTGAPDLLRDAEKYFIASNEIDLSSRLSQRARNLGVVYLKMLDLEAQGENIESDQRDSTSVVTPLLKLASDAGDLFARAEADSSSSLEASSALNNAAYARLVESQLRETYFFFDDAPEMWQSYFKAVRYAVHAKDQDSKPRSGRAYEFYRDLWDRLKPASNQFEDLHTLGATTADGTEARSDRIRQATRDLVNALNQVIRGQSLFIFWEKLGSATDKQGNPVFGWVSEDIPQNYELKRQLNREIIDTYLKGLIEELQQIAKSKDNRGDSETEQPAQPNAVAIAGKKQQTDALPANLQNSLKTLRQLHVRTYASSTVDTENAPPYRGSGWPALVDAREYLDRAEKRDEVSKKVFLTRIEADCQSYRYTMVDPDRLDSRDAPTKSKGDSSPNKSEQESGDVLADLHKGLGGSAREEGKFDPLAKSKSSVERCNRLEEPRTAACLNKSISDNEKRAGKNLSPGKALNDWNRFCSPLLQHLTQSATTTR